MGKGEAAGKGSGEGWGEGEGRGRGMAKNGQWNHGVFSNCFPLGMCKSFFVSSNLLTNLS